MAQQSSSTWARVGAIHAKRSTLGIVVTLVILGCGGGGAAPPAGPAEPTVGAPTETPAGLPPSTSPAPPPVTTPTPLPAPSAPSNVTISTANRSYSPTPVTIALNGTVTWNIVEERHNVTFVGTAPSGGNIPDTEEGGLASRTFSTPGTYQYECTRHRDKGMRGTIIVESASAPAAPNTPAPTPPSSTPNATVTTPSARFSPTPVTIPVGGTVTWQFSEARHNVTFQGNVPANGSIPDSDPGTSASRTFTAAGIYDYQCTRHSGMTGRVVVQ